MCLRIKKWDRPCTASENLKVYKVYHNTIFGDLLSYYRLARTVLGEQPRVKMNRRENNYESLRGPHFEDELIDTGYHSFNKLEDAKGFVLSEINNKVIARYKFLSVLECTIPRGTEFYRGTFLGKYESLASETITVDKEVEQFLFPKLW